MNTLEHSTHDVLCIIFGFISTREVLMCRVLSKRMNENIIKNHFWKEKCLKLDPNVRKKDDDMLDFWFKEFKNLKRYSNWNMFYNDFPINLGSPPFFQHKNWPIIKMYLHRKQQTLYCFRDIRATNKICITILDMKDLSVKSELRLNYEGKIIKIKAYKTVFALLTQNYIKVFRINSLKEIELILERKNESFNIKMIPLNEDYICFGEYIVGDSYSFHFEIWDLKKQKKLDSIRGYNFRRCWIYKNKFFVLIMGHTWSLHGYNMENLTTKNSIFWCFSISGEILQKHIHRCSPYLIVSTFSPGNRYVFYNYKRGIEEFYCPLPKKEIIKFYHTKNKFIGITTDRQSFVLLKSIYTKKTKQQISADTLIEFRHGLTKVIGNIHPNNWNVCSIVKTAEVFWIPIPNYSQLFGVYCNKAIYLKDGLLYFIQPEPLWKYNIDDTAEMLKEIADENPISIHRFRSMYQFMDTKVFCKQFPQISAESLNPILYHGRKLIELHQLTFTTFSSEFGLEDLITNDNICLGFIDALQDLIYHKEEIISIFSYFGNGRAEDFIQKGKLLLLEYIDQLPQISRFLPKSLKCIHRFHSEFNYFKVIHEKFYLLLDSDIIQKTREAKLIYMGKFKTLYRSFLQGKAKKVLKENELTDINLLKSIFEKYRMWHTDLEQIFETEFQILYQSIYHIQSTYITETLRDISEQINLIKSIEDLDLISVKISLAENLGGIWVLDNDFKSFDQKEEKKKIIEEMRIKLKKNAEKILGESAIKIEEIKKRRSIDIETRIELEEIKEIISVHSRLEPTWSGIINREIDLLLKEINRAITRNNIREDNLDDFVFNSGDEQFSQMEEDFDLDEGDYEFVSDNDEE